MSFAIKRKKIVAVLVIIVCGLVWVWKSKVQPFKQIEFQEREFTPIDLKLEWYDSTSLSLGQGHELYPNTEKKTFSNLGVEWELAAPASETNLIDKKLGNIEFYTPKDSADAILIHFNGNSKNLYHILRRTNGNNSGGVGWDTLSELRASFDPITKLYLWYTFDSSFANGRAWPVQAWLFNPTGSQSVEPIPIPVGIWRHTSMDEWRCFSCGCSCYSEFEMYAFNRRILMAVWGRSFSRDETGLFLLDNNKWKKLSENTSFKLSANGCEVSVSNKVISLCQRPSE